MFAKIGPRMNRITRLPDDRSSSITSAPEDVRRHQVGRELNAVELQVDGFRQLLDDQRLRQARHAAEQAVPAGEKRNQDFAQDATLADDRLPELALQPRRHLGDAVDRYRRVGRAPGDVHAPFGHLDRSVLRRFRGRSIVRPRRHPGLPLGRHDPSAARATTRFVRGGMPAPRPAPAMVRHRIVDRDRARE